MRPTFQDGQHRYVLDDDGLREYCVFYIPPEECPGDLRGVVADAL